VKTAAAVATLVVIGVILADFVAHPQGTQTAGNVANGVLSSTYGALLGSA
jgi:uncharacterized protein YqgC (DUF456 family)